MVKVLGPGNIPITSPAGAAPVRSSAAAFGAPQAEAVDKVGHSIAAVGQTLQRFKDKQQDAADQAFLDQYDLDSDLTYGDGAQEEGTNAGAGADGLTERVRQRFETDAEGVMERVRGKGFSPSDKALAKAESIKLRRQHQYLRSTAVYETNERVRNFSVQLDNSLATIAQRGVAGGDVEGALTRAEQSIASHQGVLPPADLDKMRERAAKHFVEQVKANGDPDELEGLVARLMQGGEKPATAADAETPARAPASTFAIPDAQRASLPAGMRNNNPGNIKYTSRRAFPGVAGPSRNTDQGDPQAVFSTPQEGMNAAADLALRKYRGGKTTADALVAGRMGWTPGNTEAAANIARTMGIAPGDDLGLDQPENMARFLKALTVQEHGAASRLYPDELYAHAAGGGGGVPSTIRGALAREVSADLPQFQALIEKRREQKELRARASAIISGEEPVDPGSKADQDTMEKVIKATDIPERLGQADPAAAGQLTALIKQTGFVPDAAISQLRASSVNGTPEQKTFALETAANLMREKPGALEASEKSRSLRDDAQLYETLTLEAGISSQDALTRIAELRTPEFAKRKESLKKELAEGGTTSPIAQLAPADIAADYDGWFTSAPEIGGSPRQAGVVFDTYRDLVKDHYIRTGDIEVAKSMAKKDLKRTYDVTEVTGSRRLMRHPPDAYYPKIEPRGGKAPSLDYFGEQLSATVNDYVRGVGKDFGQDNPEARAAALTAQEAKLTEIPPSDIFIEAIPQTNDDVRSGRLPGYGVIWFEERDGIRVMNTAPGMVFRADVKGAREREKANREQRFRYERGKEIAAQDSAENDPARRAAKAVGDYASGLPSDTGAGDRLRSGNREFFDSQSQTLKAGQDSDKAGLDIVESGMLMGLKGAEAFGVGGTKVKLFNDFVQRGRTAPVTEKDLSKDDIEGLRAVIKTHLDYVEANKEMFKGSKAAQHAIQLHSYQMAGQGDLHNLLGAFVFSKDDDGNITIKDTYDFNEGLDENNVPTSRKAKQIFEDPERIAKGIGYKAVPEGKGVPIKINLGKIK